MSFYESYIGLEAAKAVVSNWPMDTTKDNMRARDALDSVSTLPEWVNEFLFDPESSEKIVDTIIHYPICLRDVASLVDAVIPLMELMPGDSAADEVRKFCLTWRPKRK